MCIIINWCWTNRIKSTRTKPRESWHIIALHLAQICKSHDPQSCILYFCSFSSSIFFAFCLFVCIAWHLVCTNASSEGGCAWGVRELLHLKSNMYAYIFLFTLFIEIDGIHFSNWWSVSNASCVLFYRIIIFQMHERVTWIKRRSMRNIWTFISHVRPLRLCAYAW